MKPTEIYKEINKLQCDVFTSLAVNDITPGLSFYTGKFGAVVSRLSGKQTNKHGDYGVVPLEHSTSPQA